MHIYTSSSRIDTGGVGDKLGKFGVRDVGTLEEVIGHVTIDQIS